MSEKPKRKGDWIGRKVRLLRQIENNGGSIFPEGTVMRVTGNHGGLRLEIIEDCDKCRISYKHRLRGVAESSVELLPKEEANYGQH